MGEPIRHDPFAAALAALPVATPGAPCRVTERTGIAIVGIAARRGRLPVLQAMIATQCGAGLPVRGCVVVGATTILATGPSAWLVIQETPQPGWAQAIAAQVQACAMTVDQSGGYAVLRLSGPAAEALLQHGIFLDLDSGAFPPGTAAVTMAAHIGLILWREETDTFCLALPRSYADSAWHWLATAAAGADIPLARGA